MSLNDNILTVRKNMSSDAQKQEDVFHLNLVVICCGFFSSLINPSESYLSASLGTIGVAMCIIGFFVTLFINKKLSFKNYILYNLHYITFGQNKRNLAIKEISQNKRKQEQIKLESRPSNYFIDNEIFDSLTPDSLEDWIKLNIHDSAAVIALCKERSFLEDGEFDMNFLYWTQMIPIGQNINTIRTILRSSKISKINEVSDMSYMSRDSINKVFANYTDSDLIRLFTGPMSIREYIQTVVSAIHQNISLPVHSTIRDLFSIKESKWKIGPLKEGIYGDFRLKQILSYSQDQEIHSRMRIQFQQEITQHTDGPRTYYVLMNKNKPIFYLRLLDGNIRISKFSNKSVSSEDKLLIDGIVTEAGYEIKR